MRMIQKMQTGSLQIKLDPKDRSLLRKCFEEFYMTFEIINASHKIEIIFMLSIK